MTKIVIFLIMKSAIVLLKNTHLCKCLYPFLSNATSAINFDFFSIFCLLNTMDNMTNDRCTAVALEI